MEPELGLGNPVRGRGPGAANSSLSESPAAKRVDTKHTPAGLHPAATNTPPLDNFEYIDAPCSRCHQRQQRRCARTHTDVSLPTFGRVVRHVLIALHLPNASFLLCTPLHESSPIINIFVLQHPRAMVTRHGGLTTVICRSTTVRSDASIFNLAPSLPLSYVGCRQFHQLPRATPTAHSNLICSAHFHGNFRQLITAYLAVSAYANMHTAAFLATPTLLFTSQCNIVQVHSDVLIH